LAGATSSGVLLGIFMANAGASWDNAKKWIEEGNLGGKGTEVHAAAVIGDTVGDPLKDTAGPSMNILIKLMAVVSLVFAPLIM
jgi:K(+)-stimulated pyrophosphate-energized sodium pump